MNDREEEGGGRRRRGEGSEHSGVPSTRVSTDPGEAGCGIVPGIQPVATFPACYAAGGQEAVRRGR